VTDRQTDRQTSCHGIVRAMHTRRAVKTNEPILMPIGTSGSRGKAMKGSTLGSGGQKSRSHEAKAIFGGLAEG